MQIDAGEKTVVGVNKHTIPPGEDHQIPILKIDQAIEADQLDRLRALRKTRDAAAVTRSLEALRLAAAGTDNLMPRILDAVKAYATVGEICACLKTVFGEYRETPVL